LSTIVGAATFSQYAKQYPEVAFIAGCVSITVAVLSGVTTFLNPNKREASHLAAAHGFDKINSDARVFWSVECWLEVSETILTAKLKEFIDRKNELNGKSPQILTGLIKRPRRALRAARLSSRWIRTSPALPDQSNQLFRRVSTCFDRQLHIRIAGVVLIPPSAFGLSSSTRAKTRPHSSRPIFIGPKSRHVRGCPFQKAGAAALMARSSLDHE
jgi:hypothetical protein